MDTPPRVDGRSAPRVLYRAGVTWLVYARKDPYDRRSRPDLIFESDLVIRRVREYPEDWRQLDDDALWALSWAR